MKQSGLSLALCLVCILPLFRAQSAENTTTLPPNTTTTSPPTTTPAARDMTYWLTFCKIIHPGDFLTIKVYAPTAKASFTLRLELMDRAGNLQQTGQNFTLNKTSQVQNVDLQISKTLPRRYDLYLRATATGGITFDGFERVEWSNKRLSIFIETDKAVYKPGETIRFRALVMHPDVKVAEDEPMDIVITDPKNNMVRRWHAVNSSYMGVFQGEMPTSHYPPLGVWKIKVTADGEDTEKTFKMLEYELPRFEVKTKFPSYGLHSDIFITPKISATYVFGLPLGNATGKMVAIVQSFFFSKSLSIEKTFQLDKSGEATVNFTVQELDNLLKSTYKWMRLYSVEFKTTVTDPATDDVMTESTTLKFYSYSKKMSFTLETPSSYKTGLTYPVYMEALQPNGEPLENAENTSVRLEANSAFWKNSTWTRVTLMNRTVTLDHKARAKVLIKSVPDGLYSFYMRAYISGGLTAYKTVFRFTSKANVFLQMKFKHTKALVGQKARVKLYSNKPFGDFTYQIYSKGYLVECKTIKRTVASRKGRFVFRIKRAMAPFLDVVAFFETTGGEIVADRLVLKLDDYTDNPVSLRFKRKEVKPGQKTKLIVNAATGTYVFLLGVDKSVRLLGTGNDITQDDILSELRKYSQNNVFFWRGFWFCCSGVRDVDDIFRVSKAGFITDGFIQGRNPRDIPYPFLPTTTTPTPRTIPPGAVFAPRPTALAGTMRPALFMAADARRPSVAKAASTPAEQLRKFFPVTWLWRIVAIKKGGRHVVVLPAPDTITTWHVTAFGVHREKGLSVAEKPAELLTIKRLFVTLDLPYSAIRGEVICFKALVFNNYYNSVNVSITLAKNCTAFKSISVKVDPYNPDDVIEVRESVSVTKNLGELASGGMAVTTFCISPESLGDMPVQVTLHANRPADGLVRTIRIKPEGVERSQSYPVLIELTSSGNFSTSVYLTLPEKIVPGSLRITVQIVGDVLGEVAENLGDLLKMPYGCGEQNLINFAPNTYLILYLRKTGRLTPAILQKAQTFMLAGYQRQLLYQRFDGSFSAFGNSDRSGSLWLTAFVVKCFVQAAAIGNDIITIDPKMVIRAVTWIKGNQNSDGSFNEPGVVFHKAMQGGSSQGTALAAYTAIALQEAVNSFADQMDNATLAMVKSVLSKSVVYLENKLPAQWTKNDSYVACIIAYALNLAGSSKASLALTMMDNLAVIGGLLKYWDGPPPSTKQTYYPWYRKTQPRTVEMTAYALLAMMQQRPVTSGIPVVRWLNNQRTPNGGFMSTQDTVLGMEALAAMSGLALGDDFSPISVIVSWFSGKPRHAYLSIDKDNVMLLQKVHLPLLNDGKFPRHITIGAKTPPVPQNFTAFVLLQVTTFYNLQSTTAQQVFRLRSTILNSTRASFVLQVCVSRVDGKSQVQSMIVMQVSLPTGHSLDKKASSYGSSRTQDFETDRVVFYYYELDSTEDCSVLTLTMTSGVGNIKPASVVVYDYYNQVDELTGYYYPPIRGACDAGSDDGACAKV